MNLTLLAYGTAVAGACTLGIGFFTVQYSWLWLWMNCTTTFLLNSAFILVLGAWLHMFTKVGVTTFIPLGWTIPVAVLATLVKWSYHIITLYRLIYGPARTIISLGVYFITIPTYALVVFVFAYCTFLFLEARGASEAKQATRAIMKRLFIISATGMLAFMLMAVVLAMLRNDNKTIWPLAIGFEVTSLGETVRVTVLLLLMKLEH